MSHRKTGEIVMKPRKRLLVLCLVLAIGLAFVQILAAEETETININEASEDELIQLRGIGPIRAERVVQYREKHGPFRSPEDIMKVKGIGPKTWEKNKDRITVE